MPEESRPPRPSRVIYLLKKFPRHSETFILNEILGLEGLGVEVEIFSLWRPDDGRFHASLSRLRARARYLPESLLLNMGAYLGAVFGLLLDRPGTVLRSLGRALVTLRPTALKRWAQAAWLAWELRDEPVTGVHCHFALSATSVAMHLRALNGNPFTFTAHAKDIFMHSVDPRLFRRRVDASAGVITVSDFNRRFILEHLAPGRDEKVVRIHNGVDLDAFSPPPPEERLPTRLLAVSRLVEKKGLETLIDACTILAERGVDFDLRIAGSGPLKGALRARAKTRGLAAQLTLLGALPQEEVRDEMRRAAVAVAPCVVASDGNRDALPTVLLEALATGTPCVASDLSGIPEIIESRREGILVPPGDAEALAEAISGLLSDGDSRRTMSEHARTKAERLFDHRDRVKDVARLLAERHHPKAQEDPLRVGHILTMFPRLSETFILREIRALEDLGAEVTIFSQKPTLDVGQHSDVQQVKADVIVLSPWWRDLHRALWAHLILLVTSPRRYGRLVGFLLSRFNRPNWKKFWRCARIAVEVKRRRIEHLHCHFMTGNARLAEFVTTTVGVSHSITAHAKDIYASGLSDRKIKRRLLGAAFVATISERNVRHLRERQPQANVVLIPNAVDSTEFPFLERERRASGESLHVLAVGRLVQKKGFHTLVDAAALLATDGGFVEVHIAGDGEERAALANQIEACRLGDRVQLLGAMTQEALRAEFNWADVLTVPSVEAAGGDVDGMPVVILEAMALGVPVIASRLSGIPEVVIDGETGVLVHAGDAQALAQALSGARPPTLAELSRAARLRIEREHDLTQSVRRLHDLMLQAARSAP